MRKRGIALVLAAMLLWLVSAPAGAAVNPFWDLKSDHWAFDSVIALAEAGLIEGYPDGSFGGDRNFTRYEMAMVFARILARFDRLIDEKIQQGIAAETDDLERQIADVREQLTLLITERYDELREAIARLEAHHVDGMGAAGAGDAERAAAAQAAAERAEAAAERAEAAALAFEGELTPEARAVLRDLVAAELEGRLSELASVRDVDELARRIVGLEGGLSDLERRMLQLEGSTPTRAEAQMIAERVVAEALANREREVTAALAAAQGDREELGELIDARVNELAGHMDRMTDEFRSELELLGVRVDEIERRLAAHEAEDARQAQLLDEQGRRLDAAEASIDAIREQLGTFRFSGSAESRFRRTDIEGTGPFYKDPRDVDSREYMAGDQFRNILRLNVETQPAPNVDVKASLVFNDLFGEGPDAADPRLNFDLTTPGVLRRLHLGDINLKRVGAAAYDKYTLHEGAAIFEDDWRQDWKDVKVQGALVNLVYGLNDSTDVNAFASRVAPSQYALGAAASYTLSDAFNLTFRAVRRTPNPAATDPDLVKGDTTASVASTGQLDMVTYGAVVASNWSEAGGATTNGTAIDGYAQLPILLATAKLEYTSVSADFAPVYGKVLNSGQIVDTKIDYELPSRGDDWLERRLSPPPDKAARGETEMSATFSAPIFGMQAAVTFGSREDDNAGIKAVNPGYTQGKNVYTQVSVDDIDFAGLGIGVLYDTREDDNGNTDNTLRAEFGTTLLGADVSAVFHNRTNEQGWLTAEAEQRATWIKASRDFSLIVPLSFEGHVGMNQVLSRTATRLGVSTEYPLGPLTLKAGYRTEQNAVGALDDDLDLVWWKNASWTTNTRDVTTVGFDYTIGGIFGSELKTGYEYRLARVNDAPYGTARNTFTASYEKSLRGGEALLRAEGKYVTGGNPDEDLGDGDPVGEPYGNDRDLVANVKLIYPIFEGADLTLGGEWVSSFGAQHNEYSVFRLNAGVKVEF